MAAYLLVPHNMEGAKWAVLIVSATGALAGYLWHNAEPSAVLMGDAGSRFLGLLVGIAVLASGNPALILVVAPVVLVNGGTGLVKLALLRALKRMGVDTRSPQKLAGAAQQSGGGAPPSQFVLVRLLHRVRLPLHDHCRKELRWSNPQVLLRFALLQVFLTPLLLGLLVKVR
jgi:phospho-N-acetylmuramoyl-pentapeptide-transferase